MHTTNDHIDPTTTEAQMMEILAWFDCAPQPKQSKAKQTNSSPQYDIH